MPVIAKSALAITRAELPKRGVPGRAVPRLGFGTGGDDPALHDRTQEAVCVQTFPMNAREFVGLEDTPAVSLEGLELGEGGGEFIAWDCHRRVSLCEHK